MPSKKKKYNARFPPARIKKIMQTDEDVGKVAAAVPVIISRALELFIDSLIEKTASVTRSKNAKTLSSSHVKQAIHSEKTFDFLRDLVKNVPDHQTEEEMEAAPSGSGVVEKKPKVQRSRKPREDGGKVRGRPRKIKVEEKKDSASEGTDEETETDEETADEDSQVECSDQAPPQGGCNSRTPPQGGCSSHGHCDTPTPPQSTSMQQECNQGSSTMSPGVPVSQGSSIAPSTISPGMPVIQCSSIAPSTLSPGMPVSQGSSIAPSPLSPGMPVSQGSSIEPSTMSPGMAMSQGSSIAPVQITHQSMDQEMAAVSSLSTIHEKQSSAQYASAMHGPPIISPMQHQFPAVSPGFPMPNMIFPQYPFMTGGQPVPFIHPQSSVGPMPAISTDSMNHAYTVQCVGSIPHQFIPTHPTYMMPQMGPNVPLLNMGPGVPMRPPPPLVPINTMQNCHGNDGDVSMPLDMSLAGNTRSPNTTVPSCEATVTKIPTPCGMPPLTHVAMSPMTGIPHPSRFTPWGVNNQNCQNFQHTVSKSQILGPPPLVSSTLTHSTASVTENGKHKQNYDSVEIVAKKAKQKFSAANSYEQQAISFPDLANIMNRKPILSVENDDDDDDDYDT